MSKPTSLAESEARACHPAPEGMLQYCYKIERTEPVLEYSLPAAGSGDFDDGRASVRHLGGGSRGIPGEPVFTRVLVLYCLPCLTLLGLFLSCSWSFIMQKLEENFPSYIAVAAYMCRYASGEGRSRLEDGVHIAANCRRILSP